MKTVDEWKALLRKRIRAALGAKDKPALAVLRETLAAIDNAEAPAMAGSASPAQKEGPFAGSAGSLGAGEVERLALTPEAILQLVEREIRERQEAAAEYTRLGRPQEAGVLVAQAELLAALITEAA